MSDRLYELLPAVYRVRDADQGGQLRALMAIIEQELETIHKDIDGLYENWFIETCEEWVVPYIADLLGIKGLPPARGKSVTQRSFVANTLDFRRRKGTAAVLEQLAKDVSGYDARVQEYFDRLVTSTYYNHIRLGHPATVDVRDHLAMEAIDTAFDDAAHNVDVRSIGIGRGKHNIPNIGLFLWRVKACLLTQSPAVAQSPTQYRLSPLGIDAPIFTKPRGDGKITQLATPLDVPEPISRRRMAANLPGYYGPGLSVELIADGIAVPEKQVVVCDLSDDQGGDWNRTRAGFYVIDPVLGRVLTPSDAIPKSLSATFYYGAVRDMGGGEYRRRQTFGTQPVTPISGGASIQTAVDAAGDIGTFEIEDSGRYSGDLSVTVPADQRLEIRAGDERRPTLVLTKPLVVKAKGASEVVLNGLLIIGGPVRIEGPVRKVTIQHCTLVPGTSLKVDGEPVSPGAPSLVVLDAASTVEVDVIDSILGPIHADIDAKINVTGSIVDATNDSLIAFGDDNDPKDWGGSLQIVESTVIGRISSQRTPLISDSILVASAPTPPKPVRFQRRQEGCVRYSYVPPAAETPRKFHCVPASATDHSTPEFSALRYGQPAYGQLHRNTPDSIRLGADDGGETGAMHDLYEPQREADLRYRLVEYLRFGLKAGLFFES
ncbi:MAG TPA: phage tail protein [Fimbriimonadaceae bacterium]|nr:phage tail protein [Fimbriimonadaceae bacterium]